MRTLEQVKEICPTTSWNWLKEGAILVDVRELTEVKELAFDVLNVMEIPLSVFEDRFQEIPMDRKVILACAGGERSLRATGFLVNHGYRNVVNMSQGLNRWAQRGFPVKGDRSGQPAQTSCCSSPNCC